MAQTKKNTGSSHSSAGKKTTTGKRANSGSQTKAASENKTYKNDKTEKNELISQAAPYILAITAVLLSVCIILGEGKVGGGIKNFFTGLFSGAAYAFPLFMFVRAFLWKRDVSQGQNYGRNTSTLIVFLSLTMFLHIVGDGANELDFKLQYADGMNLIGGGAVGGILGELLYRGFGKVCSVIILVALMLILSLYVAGLTPKGIYIWIAYHIKYAGEKRAERAEKRKNAPPTKREIQEEEYLKYLREKKLREKEQREKEALNSGVPEIPSVADSSGNVKKSVQPATVYKVKKRRLTEMDIPVDDITPPEVQKERDIEGFEEAENIPPVDTEENNAEESNSGIVDEKIFDEVMRRTKERIEKGKRTDTIKDTEDANENIAVFSDIETPNTDSAAEEKYYDETQSAYNDDNTEIDTDIGDFDEYGTDDETNIEAGDVLDAVEIAAMNIRDNTAHNDEEYETDTVKLAMSTSNSTKTTPDEVENSGEIDMSQIFAGNGEDLINRVSEAHLKDSAAKLESASQSIQQNGVITVKGNAEYKRPPIELLTIGDDLSVQNNIKDELQENAVKLVETLRSFNVKVKIENISRGPTITRYELCPEPGTKVSSIRNLVDDIALNLATTGVRIEAPIPGKSAVGIEVPNKKQTTVHLRSLISSPEFENAKSELTVCLGEDVAGEPVYFDIAKMPHLLIAGTTGSGKSVCINSIIMSLLYKADPSEVKLMLIDPKKVELSIYKGIPHLLVPVISETKKAAGALSWAVGEMERRYGLLENVGVRDINNYNAVTKDNPNYEHMGRIVIIIDELADFMMSAPDAVEDSICRIAQKARAAGMHLIIGTQRPSTNVITGLIKANIPSRIAFTVTNNIDSRVILDKGGAENLIGRGDMLFSPVGALKLRRVQGAFVSETEVESVVSYIKENNSECDTYSESISNQIEREAQKCDSSSGKKGSADSDEFDDEEDPMLNAVIELAIDSGKISTSLVQRRLALGYGRAAKLIDRMESLGMVSAPNGQKPREVLITKQEYMERRLNNDID